MKAQLEQLTWKQIVALHKRLEGGGIGDYARRNKAGEIDLILGKFKQEQIEQEIATLGNVVALPKREEPQQTEEQSIDVAAEVQRILEKPYNTMSDEITALVRAARKPAVIVEKRVEVPVEKIVEKIVEVSKGGKQQTATVVSLFAPKVIEKTAKEVFGITLLMGDGSPLMVEVYNDPLAPTIDQHYIFDKQDLHDTLTSIRRNRNVWFGGPRGTGKTTFTEQICARLKRSCCRVNLNGATDKTEVLGGDTLRAGDVQYREGVILQGIRRAGTIVLLDEVGHARAEYLAALHAVLEKNGCYTINETGETVAPAKGVVFIAADNSTGHGDQSGAYAGVKKMNSAFLDRFAKTLIFDYMPPSIEARIVAAKTGIRKVAARHICDFLKVCRAKATTGDIAEPPSLRQALYFAEALIDGAEVARAFETTIASKADPDSRETLRQTFNATINQFDLREVVAGRATAIGEVTEANATEEESS